MPKMKNTTTVWVTTDNCGGFLMGLGKPEWTKNARIGWCDWN
jgi:hypothetical protein